MRDQWERDKGHYLIRWEGYRNPPRQGVRWNDAERADLRRQVEAGAAIEDIAQYHERTVSAIRIELDRQQPWPVVQAQILAGGILRRLPVR